MTDLNRTHVAAIVDRSGSMHSIKDDTVGGFDAFIAKQRTQPGESTVSLFQFDDRYEAVYSNLPVAEVPGLVLEPRGSTALLDAIGRTINTTRHELAQLPADERPGNVIVVIMTDGYENASREFSWPATKQLIETQRQADDWTFLFMGADQDAIAAASRMGIGTGHALSYASSKTGEAWDAAGESIGRLKAARRSGMPAPMAAAAAAFTAKERKDTQ